MSGDSMSEVDDTLAGDESDGEGLESEEEWEGWRAELEQEGPTRPNSPWAGTPAQTSLVAITSSSATPTPYSAPHQAGADDLNAEGELNLFQARQSVVASIVLRAARRTEPKKKSTIGSPRKRLPAASVRL